MISDNSHTSDFKIKALVVDDSVVLRELMELTLKPMGVEVQFTDNGEDALALAQLNSYDIIFLDIILPGINGYQVCKKLKSDHELKHVPVIMLTSKDSAFDKIRGVMAGTNVYMTKPVSRPELLKTIEKYFPVSISHKLRAAPNIR